ncbi:MAG: PorT family protein [Chitinophagales bacterium]|nr:PorT family protein [Chitinophagales bacterium]HAE12861.1 hypothetical protein [Bacteroidota bacterium]MCB9020803.1 PorT family protein [Chitinophagales bacterium]MCB9031279.1 PorT family protein [Chitinophagales bacterium]HPE97213.1 outer membrane beta-barrel protein [Chitinophagales bacterium]
MERGILFFTVLVLGHFLTFGQIQHDPKDDEFHVFDAGIVGGINFTQVHGDNLAGFNKIGMNAGGIAHINFRPGWSVSFEVLYSQKGSATYPDPNDQSAFEYKLQLDYAEVPVLINYLDHNRLIAFAGLSYGRLFRAREVINGNETPNIEEGLRTSDLSYVFGGTFLIGETRHWGAQFRYQQSFLAIGDSAQPNVPGLLNVVISLRGIYYF